MKILPLILLVIISSSVYACEDIYIISADSSKIVITKGKEKNAYQVTVQRYLENRVSGEAQIFLLYSKHDLNGPYDLSWTEDTITEEAIKLTVNDKTLVADFKVKKRESRPYIIVSWSEDHYCGTVYENTIVLEAE